jgi:thioredoxin-dependent peroxiredoxin
LGCLFCSSSWALTTGDIAPDIAGKNQNGKLIHLSDFHGKYILVYFYPKDDTPGCTKEATNFQTELANFKHLNAVILGVSAQDEASHQKFIAKHGLQFDLLVDSSGEIRKAFSVGTIPVLGLAQRQSILVGPDGKVIHFYNNVDPAKHAQEVLEDLKKSQSHG